ncbi:MAG: DMT family transporter [Acidiferrobacteraceae bacterium]|jgi:drug/metabolite transporter (DMT)-like permease|nr:DMT family transporter [Acidiferrobacteraceae bacterium]
MSISHLIRDGHEGLARISCLLGGAVWGVYWIPLRALDANGISGIWATALFHLIPLIVLAPVIILRSGQIRAAGFSLQLVGATLGLAMLLYSTSFLYTDVIHAVSLYYLTPVWSTLLARVWLKEPITPARVVGIFLGLLGMLVILNAEQGFPWPRNVGDWMALASGIIWAIAANLMRRHPNHSALDIAPMWFLWCTILSIVSALFLQAEPLLTPVEALTSVLPWFLPIVLLVVLPGYLAITWGTPQLNPGTVGVLFMTEISVGAASAALLTQEPFGGREIVGVSLIVLAGLAEVILPAMRRAGRSLLGRY